MYKESTVLTLASLLVGGGGWGVGWGRPTLRGPTSPACKYRHIHSVKRPFEPRETSVYKVCVFYVIGVVLGDICATTPMSEREREREREIGGRG